MSPRGRRILRSPSSSAIKYLDAFDCGSERGLEFYVVDNGGLRETQHNRAESADRLPRPAHGFFSPAHGFFGLQGPTQKENYMTNLSTEWQLKYTGLERRLKALERENAELRDGLLGGTAQCEHGGDKTFCPTCALAAREEKKRRERIDNILDRFDKFILQTDLRLEQDEETLGGIQSFLGRVVQP